MRQLTGPEKTEAISYQYGKTVKFLLITHNIINLRKAASDLSTIRRGFLYVPECARPARLAPSVGFRNPAENGLFVLQHIRKQAQKFPEKSAVSFG